MGKSTISMAIFNSYVSLRHDNTLEKIPPGALQAVDHGGNGTDTGAPRATTAQEAYGIHHNIDPV